MLRRITNYLFCITSFSLSITAQHLEINSISPAANQTNIATNAEIAILFNQPIESKTLADGIFLRGSQTGRILSSITKDASPLVKLTPHKKFRPGEIITLTLTTAIKGIHGETLARGHSYSFTVKHRPSAGTFAQRDVSEIGVQGRDIMALDHDGDGDLDVLTANEGIPERIYVFENLGDGNFCEINTGGNFRYLEVFDIDGDGDFDNFGVTGSFNTEINWFENEGTAPYTERFLSSEDAWTLAGGDIDSDGDIDLLAAVLLPNRLLWFANDGSGNFAPAVSIPTTFGGGSDSYFHIVDMNGDGAMDILGFHRDDRNLVWYRNDGSENFTEILIDNRADRSRTTYGDVDGDGDIDIAIVSHENSPTETVAWYENTATGFTEHPITTSATRRLYAVDIADVDGDGATDILAGGYWFKNDGNENFSEQPINLGLSQGANLVSNGLDVADLDEDGDLDILTIGSYTFSWQEQSPIMEIQSTSPQNGEFGVPVNSSISITFSEAVTTDMQSRTAFSVVSKLSGHIEVIITGLGTNTVTLQPLTPLIPGDRIEVSVSDRIIGTTGKLDYGNGFVFHTETQLVNQVTFQNQLIQAFSGTASGATIADIDGDGDLDIAACSFTELYWFENNGSGSFTVIPLPLNNSATRVACFDQNNDGFMDIWVDMSGNDPAEVYLNDGSQNFTIVPVLIAQDVQQQTDINHDGDIDLLNITRINDWLLWREAACDGYRNLSFVPRIANRAAAAADLDNDGDTDFVTSSSLGAQLYENFAHFNYLRTPFDAVNTVALELADLNGDGFIDPIFAESFSGIVWYQTSLAGGDSLAFGNSNSIAALDQDPRDVIATDLDGDGDPDIAAVSRNDDKVVWYENRLNEATNDFGSEQLVSNIADGPVKVLSGDLDGDGDMDLLTLSTNDDEVNWFENTGNPVGVSSEEDLLPTRFSLNQNYPNPFNPSTTITYSLSRSEMVNLEVYNTSGQKVQTLISVRKPAGNHSVKWDGNNNAGEPVASGVYYYQLKAGTFSATRKLLLLR